MINIKQSIEFRMGELYKVSYRHGSDLLEIEVLKETKWYEKLFKVDYKWKRIYFGFSSPIQKAVKFFEESKSQVNERENKNFVLRSSACRSVAF